MSAVVIGRVVFLFASRQLYHWRGAKHAFTCYLIIATGKAVVNAKMPTRTHPPAGAAGQNRAGSASLDQTRLQRAGFAVTVYTGEKSRCSICRSI